MKSKQRLSDLRTLSEDQLNDELLKLKKEQFNLRFQRATGQLENSSRVRVVRRDIARVKTIAQQKRAKSKEGEFDAQAHAAGNGCELDAEEDGGRPRRAAFHASGAQED